MGVVRQTSRLGFSPRNMVVPEASRVNGTYHAAETLKERVRRTRLLIGLGAAVAVLAGLNVVLVNADMTRIEQSGPERLALAGGGSNTSSRASCSICSVPTSRPARSP